MFNSNQFIEQDIIRVDWWWCVDDGGSRMYDDKNMCELFLGCICGFEITLINYEITLINHDAFEIIIYNYLHYSQLV